MTRKKRVKEMRGEFIHEVNLPVKEVFNFPIFETNLPGIYTVKYDIVVYRQPLESTQFFEERVIRNAFNVSGARKEGLR